VEVVDMPSEVAHLGELEGPVLEELWDSGELPTPVVFERIGKPRGLAYTTILTVLQRLHRKGLAGRREEGRGHIYYAAVSREEFSRRRGQALAASLAALGEAGITGFLAEAERGDHGVFDLLKAKLATAE
jgi:predicted transcriptional regulator